MRRGVVGIFLLVVTSFTMGSVHAQVPPLIRYQGTLVDANNVPLEGTVTLTFRLYEAATGGTPIWTETQSGVPVSRGVFNVLLGQVTPPTLPFDKNYWLSTQVGTDTEMSPRQRLTSVPYAYRASIAERLAEQPSEFAVDTAGTLPNGLAAYWKLEEAGGSRADSKGTNALTDNNTVTQAAGKQGSASQFTRANSERLSIADNADLSVQDISFTFAAWVFLDSKPTDDAAVILSKSSASFLEYSMRWANGPDRFQFQVGGDPVQTSTVTVTANSFGAPATGQWIFLVGWHDAVGNTVNIQVNNGTVDSISMGANFPTEGAGSFIIGSRSDATALAWDGRIDEVGFWKRVLTAQERTDLYHAGAGNTYVPGGFYVDSALTGKRYRLMMEAVP